MLFRSRRYVLPPKQRLTDALQSKKDRQTLEEQFGVSLSEAQGEGTTDTSQPSTSVPDERLQAMESSLIRVESMMNKLRGDFDAR